MWRRRNDGNNFAYATSNKTAWRNGIPAQPNVAWRLFLHAIMYQ